MEHTNAQRIARLRSPILAMIRSSGCARNLRSEGRSGTPKAGKYVTDDRWLETMAQGGADETSKGVNRT